MKFLNALKKVFTQNIPMKALALVLAVAVAVIVGAIAVM